MDLVIRNGDLIMTVGLTYREYVPIKIDGMRESVEINLYPYEIPSLIGVLQIALDRIIALKKKEEGEI